jgi:RNA polymerase sigma-70 factor (ECF subfamily)
MISLPILARSFWLMQEALNLIKDEEAGADDAQLLACIKKGEHGAFAILVRRYSLRYYRIAYRFMVNRAEAEDVVQDAFLKLWENPESWNPAKNSAFTTWFYRVVVNLCLDRNKRKKPLPMIDEMQFADESITQEENMIERQNEMLIEKYIAALPERQRVALNLCFYEGVSNQEAAEIMGLRLKALQSLLMRAKLTLKEKLAG